MQVSIVIPTFNERQNVRSITERIRAVLEPTRTQYDIWFIDDSRDDTPEVLEELARTYANVFYVHRTHERGLGTAVVEGIHRSQGDCIVVMDADLQHPPELLPRMIAKLHAGTDVVIPSRFVPGGSDGGLNWFRKWVSWTARSIGRLAVRRLRSISDCTGGFFGFHRQVVVDAELNPVGWKILMEILVKGHYTTVHEIPYSFHARDAGESKMSLKEQWNYLRHVAKLVWTSPEERRFYLFCLVGGLGTLVNLAVLGILVYVFHMHGAFPSVVASLIAMLHNFVWNDRVTWKGHAHPVLWKRLMQAPIFMAISCVSIGLTALFEQGFLKLHWNELIGQFIGIVISTGWSFVANNRWTWRNKNEQTAGARSRIQVSQDPSP